MSGYGTWNDPSGLMQRLEQEQESKESKKAWKKQQKEKNAAQITAVSAVDLMKMNIPEREVLMAEGCNPLFFAQSLNQILAWRGVGKTLFGLGIAGAMTAGESILGFKASRAMKVMYVDGELPLAQMKERVAQQIKRPENFFAVNAELGKHAVSIDLKHEKTWSTLLESIDRVKPNVLFLDSRSTLFPGLEANKEDHQGVIQSRLQSLRLRKLCVIESHHTGKNGTQRGHSKNDDALDIQMHLKKVEGWEPGQGLKFEMGWEKVRHQSTFEAGYIVTMAQDGQWQKGYSELEVEAARWARMGKSNPEIADLLGVSKSTAQRLVAKAKRRADPSDPAQTLRT